MSDLEVYIMLAVLAIPAIGIVWLWRKIRGPQERRKNDEYSKRFLERLQAPDFLAIEGHFGVTMPLALKDFYASDLVTEDCDFEINGDDWSIAFFEPLDQDSLRESWPGCEQFVSVANDGCGNEYVFDPKTEAKAVRFHDHETGELDDVTPSLDEFLAAVRNAINKSRSEQDGAHQSTTAS